jgi:hypothetical protein
MSQQSSSYVLKGAVKQHVLRRHGKGNATNYAVLPER